MATFIFMPSWSHAGRSRRESDTRWRAPRMLAPVPLTARLAFRAWRADDLHLAQELWGDPEVAGLITAQGRFTEEQVRERLAQEIATREEHGVQYWPVFLRDTGAHVG